MSGEYPAKKTMPQHNMAETMDNATFRKSALAMYRSLEEGFLLVSRMTIESIPGMASVWKKNRKEKTKLYFPYPSTPRCRARRAATKSDRREERILPMNSTAVLVATFLATVILERKDGMDLVSDCREKQQRNE